MLRSRRGRRNTAPQTTVQEPRHRRIQGDQIERRQLSPQQRGFAKVQIVRVSDVDDSRPPRRPQPIRPFHGHRDQLVHHKYRRGTQHAHSGPIRQPRTATQQRGRTQTGTTRTTCPRRIPVDSSLHGKVMHGDRRTATALQSHRDPEPLVVGHRDCRLPITPRNRDACAPTPTDRQIRQRIPHAAPATRAVIDQFA